ncbi:MAG: 4-(cytidine 5'-diphospho)-2-C-methyl-D-erythritol kinase [Dehalococcoidia bacterium]
MRILAPAKINLSLEVLWRRDDGYHEVRTVLQAVDLCDELEIEEADSLQLTVEPSGSAPVDGNLVLLAAARLQADFGVRNGARISLRKRIPASAGLGGGSSDAAAALLALRSLWRVPATDGALVRIAADLGSDVPFFLRGGTALGQGRGDELSPLPQPIERYAVILTPSEPDDGTKTKRLYGLLAPTDFSDGRHTESLVVRLRGGVPVETGMTNTFERVAGQAFGAYSAARAAFAEAGARNVLLSGAGPSLFALTGDEAEALQWRDRLQGAGYAVYLARLLPQWEASGYQGDPGA